MAKKGKTREEKVQNWKEYWPILQSATGDSEEHIDKKVFAASSGALALELTLLQFIKSPHMMDMAKWAALCNIVALMLNIIVHLIGQSFQHSQASKIEDFLNDSSMNDDRDIHRSIKKQDNWVLAINIVSLCFLCAGVTLLSIFTISNI